MPRFFFHLENTATPVRDTEGVELGDLAAAKCHGVTLIAEALCASPQAFWEADTYQVVVTDADGLMLFQICMMAVMAPAMGRLPTAALV